MVKHSPKILPSKENATTSTTTKKPQKKACIRPFNDGGYVCHGVFQLCRQELCWTTVEFSFVFQSRQLLRPRVTIKLCTVPANSPLRGGDVAVYVFDINQPSLLTPFYFCSCVYFFLALSAVFHSINFPDNSPLSHSLLPVLFLLYWSFQLYIIVFMKVTFSPDIILLVD